MSPNEELYRKVMCPYDLDDTSGKFIVRQYDSMDFCWCDLRETDGVDWEAALEAWMKATDNGTKSTTEAHLSYYRIFPAGTRMIFS